MYLNSSDLLRLVFFFSHDHLAERAAGLLLQRDLLSLGQVHGHDDPLDSVWSEANWVNGTAAQRRDNRFGTSRKKICTSESIAVFAESQADQHPFRHSQPLFTMMPGCPDAPSRAGNVNTRRETLIGHTVGHLCPTVLKPVIAHPGNQTAHDLKKEQA